MRQIPCQTFALIKNTLLTLLPPSPINCTYFVFYLLHFVCLGKTPFQRNEEEKIIPHSSHGSSCLLLPLNQFNVAFFLGFSLMVKPSLHSPCLSFLRCLQYSQILWAHHQVNIVTRSLSFPKNKNKSCKAHNAKRKSEDHLPRKCVSEFIFIDFTPLKGKYWKRNI